MLVALFQSSGKYIKDDMDSNGNSWHLFVLHILFSEYENIQGIPFNTAKSEYSNNFKISEAPSFRKRTSFEDSILDNVSFFMSRQLSSSSQQATTLWG